MDMALNWLHFISALGIKNYVCIVPPYACKRSIFLSQYVADTIVAGDFRTGQGRAAAAAQRRRPRVLHRRRAAACLEPGRPGQRASDRPLDTQQVGNFLPSCSFNTIPSSDFICWQLLRQRRVQGHRAQEASASYASAAGDFAVYFHRVGTNYQYFLLQAGYNVLLSDCDVVFLDNPFTTLINSQLQVLSQS